MIRALNIAERNIVPNGAAVVAVPAAAATNVIVDQTGPTSPNEIAYRYIQNIGANPLYYAFGQDASAVNCHGYIQQYQQLDCSNHRCRVSAFSPLGTSVAVTILYRTELDNSNTGTVIKP